MSFVPSGMRSEIVHSLEDDTVRVRLHFNPPLKAWDQPETWTGNGADVTFKIRDEDGDVHPRPSDIKVMLKDGFNGTDMQRLPWSRMIRMAYANARLARGFSYEMRDELQAATSAASVDARVQQKPGRRGHPDSFYANIAAEYQEHLADGKHKPTALVAEAHGVSRNTAAGWIRNARNKGFLPPANPGRVG